MPDVTSPATAYLGLGSNLGDRQAAMCAAVLALDADPRIRVDFEGGIASLYETSPVGGPAGQEAYLNSVVRITTRLSPRDLLGTVTSIEVKLGRVPRERWGARVIDIDVLLYDEVVVNDDSLTLPHPRLHRRRFVLEPLAEIGGDAVHPVLGMAISALARRYRSQGPDSAVTAVAGPTWHQMPVNSPHPGRTPISTRGARS